ncbi:MFS general substrate transporter [Fomitopsis betulina]|nr:MFS general substrate transporter [Fomitopsis betulina]
MAKASLSLQPPIGRLLRPWGLKWRSSVVTGVTTDLLVYSLIVPIIPFQLEGLGYSGVSGLVGWLLFAYSAGVVIFTPPIAHLSERYNNRQIPLIIGLVALIGSQIMFMLAPAYWLMVIARLLQGLSSTVVWVAGLALLCDTVSESSIGKQLGIAMSGLSLGFLIGPPVSGSLYDRFGFHGPFIFGIIVTAFDLIGRFSIIERKHAILWGIDPAAPTHRRTDPEINAVGLELAPEEHETALALPPTRLTGCRSAHLAMGCPEALAEPALPLHMQDVWEFNPSKVGLVYIAAVVPTLLSSSFTSYLVGRLGTGLIMVVALVFSLPWLLALIVQSSLPLFIAAVPTVTLLYPKPTHIFGIAGTVSPLTAELAAVTRQLPGVGYAHVYGAFNIAYGIGSALGPIIGGQLYDHVSRGWMAICLFGAASALMAIVLSFLAFGEVTLYVQLRYRFRNPCVGPAIESKPGPPNTST